MLSSGTDAEAIVQAKGLSQVSDEDELATLLQEIFAANPAEVEAFKGGKKKLMGFFVGQVMQKTKGQANPKLVNQLINQLLGS